MFLISGLILPACVQRSKPIPGLWGVPIASSTPLPTVVPTATPTFETPIVVVDDFGEPDPEARFRLTVIVEDEVGLLKEATIAISHSDGGNPLIVGPTADIEIPIPARWSPFMVTISRPGYKTVLQPFEVSLSEDMQYELTVTLKWIGEAF
jgi:hypothetical protein